MYTLPREHGTRYTPSEYKSKESLAEGKDLGYFCGCCKIFRMLCFCSVFAIRSMTLCTLRRNVVNRGFGSGKVRFKLAIRVCWMHFRVEGSDIVTALWMKDLKT